ncbi:protein TONSOKU [Cornus florida]|uniref:protein TONSOKU n=1 Tax=Cornus florida TaxID=4283 RepID=UPI002896CF97|nr:protein TONSOKU [Cornus florida]
MAKDDAQLKTAKRAYRNAAEEGNRREEARWANVVGDILKNRGEYVEALKWLRIDYDVSVKHLPEKHLLPTCQSLGEVHLRLEHFKEALICQKKHLELAVDSDDLVEQQRASTQLGRTYHEMFLRSDDDHYSVRNAKKYFKSAMKLAQALKENPPSNRTSFLKEYIDAHNNIGMLEMDLDNLEAAEQILTKGLEICDEEEVLEDDDSRSRLHHNLGNVFMEQRKWEKALEHIKKDIKICKNIGHCQGEAKGYINLGELHYRVQKYDEAIRCYHKALDMAKSMEDEDALATQIEQNIVIVREAIKVLDDLKKEEQNLKKLARNMATARGTPGERKCLLQQNASLDCLIEKSGMIFAWIKHHEFAKRKKRIASELCDKEKLSDSYLVIGESYQKLRKFNKALKWYTKCWETYKSIGNLEGQALVKINIGDVLDSGGNWTGALEAFQEGYRIAVKANVPSVQLSALENMHYSNMIRFENVEEARRLQLLIDKLKQSKSRELEVQTMAGDCCSETNTEGDDQSSNSISEVSCSSMKSKSNSTKAKSGTSLEEFKDDAPLISLLRSHRNSSKIKTSQVERPIAYGHPTEASSKSMSISFGSQQTVGRKRVRVILSDDEGEIQDEAEGLIGRLPKCPAEDVATSDELKSRNDLSGTARAIKDVSSVASKCAISASTPVNLEESTCSYKSSSPKVAGQNVKDVKSSSTNEIVDTSNFHLNNSIGGNDASENLVYKYTYGSLQHIKFQIDGDLIQVKLASCMAGDKLSIECLKVEVACIYYLQLPIEKRSRGLLPIIGHLKCGDRALDSLGAVDTLKDHLREKGWIEVSIDGWVQKPLMKLYIDCCKELFESPDLKLLKKLYNLEVSEDEVVVSECELQDISVTPLLNALHAHKTVALLDISHNLLGNRTMEKLKQVFTSSCQRYGGLALDLHCNRFGPTALFQICECPVLFARLEVLNISGNRLTDACGSYLSTILENCRALYSLNIERCSVTSRTIHKIADALNSESVLAQICLGYNHPISGNAIINLLAKLTGLKRFSELNLNGLKLSKPAVDSLCQLARTSCLSGLMLVDTSIGTDGALKLTDSLFSGNQELVKLDLSYCGLTSEYIGRLNAEISLIGGILELNLGGNPLTEEGGIALASLLMNPQCCLKVLVLSKCCLGLVGVLRILQALSDNSTLEELYLAGNTKPDKDPTSQYDLTAKQSLNSLVTKQHSSETSLMISVSEEVEAAQQGICAVNTECNELEVADSEDEPMGEPALAGFDDGCTSSCQRSPSNLEFQFIQELSSAISMATQLQMLDLSDNGFSTQIAEKLSTAWSSSSRDGIAQVHIHEQTIHLSVQGNKCCGVKPCCRRN